MIKISDPYVYNPDPLISRATRINKRKYRFHYKYNITIDKYSQLIQDQQGKCAICDTFKDDALCIDHDHITGKVRGLLCVKCNTTLGRFNDDVSILQKAILYLTK